LALQANAVYSVPSVLKNTMRRSRFGLSQSGRTAIQLQRKTVGFFALILIWGSTWSAIRIVDADLPPLRGVAVRFLLASVVLLGIMRLRGARLPRGQEWTVLLLVSTVLTALPFSITAWAEQWIGPGKTSVLFTVAPLLTAVAERTLGQGKEQRAALGRMGIAGMLLGAVGTLLVLWHSVLLSPQEGRGAAMILGMIVISSVCIVPSKRWLKDIPVVTVAALSTLMAGLALGALSIVVESGRRSQWTRSSVLAMLYLAMCSSVIGFLLYYWLLQQMQPHQLVARHFLMPFVAILEGALYLHEPVSAAVLAGLAIVLAGLAMVLYQDSRPVLDDRKT
jgi:drug/metabolite transporter (DMT)-like permease